MLIERYIIVIPAQNMPLELFADKEITSVFQDGQYASYSVSIPEIFYSVGLCGVVVFGFALAIKFWPMLPTEAHHLEPIEEAQEEMAEASESGAATSHSESEGAG